MGPVNMACSEFIEEIVRKSHAMSGDSRYKVYLWQRLTIALQRYNAICFRGTFGDTSLRSSEKKF
jgi:hypothetical protein